MRALLLTSLALASTGGVCGGGGSIPTSDVCLDPDAGLAGVISSLDLGPATAGSFQPVADDAVVATLLGAQGGKMIALRLRVRGATPPACLPQQTSVRDGTGTLVGSEPLPLNTYAETDGSRTTKPMYIRLFGGVGRGARVTVHTEAAGLLIERGLWLDTRGADGGT